MAYAIWLTIDFLWQGCKIGPRAVYGGCDGQSGTGKGFVMFISVPCSCSYTIDML